MSVYVVTSDYSDYENSGSHPVAAFATEELAAAYVKLREAHPETYTSYTIHELDLWGELPIAVPMFMVSDLVELRRPNKRYSCYGQIGYARRGHENDLWHSISTPQDGKRWIRIAVCASSEEMALSEFRRLILEAQEGNH